MSHFTKAIFQNYKTGLCWVLPFTTSMGFSSGLVENFSAKREENNKLTSIEVFTTMIGFSTLGIATGVAYPFTFPVILYTVLHND